MTTTQAHPLPRQASPTGHPRLGRTVVGGFFLVMGGVHLGLVSADAQVWPARHDLRPARRGL